MDLPLSVSGFASKAAQQQLDMISQVGKSVLNLMYPNEFELYLCALELTDQDFNTLRYFVFPVMPSSIDELIPQLTNIKKTAAGVTVLSSPTFNPTDITLSGTFGRSFKVVLGTDVQDLVSSFTVDGSVTAKSILGGATSFFDNRVKTGYGCIKILQDIIEQSQKVDENGIRRLIFYNPALGNSYLVKATNLRFSQSEDSNMIWKYTLPLKSIAPLSSVMSAQALKEEQFRLITTGFAQKETNVLLNNLHSILGSGASLVDNNVNSIKNKIGKKVINANSKNKIRKSIGF